MNGHNDDQAVDSTVTRLQPGDLVDVTIKGVPVAYERTADHSPCLVSIRADDGRRYTMPAQAAITSADLSERIDAGTLQERISKTLDAIDRMVGEQTLDPWTAILLRRNLDPNPRHWPPQAGDVWDGGMPFGGSLWFAQARPLDRPRIPDLDPPELMMVPVEGGPKGLAARTADELLASTDTLKLVYRRKDSGQ